MDTPDQSVLPEAASVHPGKMSVGRRLFAMLPMVAFGASGALLLLRGDKAGYLFFGMAAVIIGVGVVGFVHRRRLPPKGPCDPSEAWRLAGPADGGVHVFAYPRGTLWLVRVLVALSLLVGPVIYLISSPRPRGAGFWWVAVIVFVLNGGFLLLALACERYRVEVDSEGFVHFRLRRPVRHLFTELGSVALLEGGGRGSKYVLALYDRQGRCVDTYADILDGFTELVVLAKEYAFAAGVPYRYRDMWGAWTR